ncbi:uncharacterized protein COLE_00532 [Cutaneotrichosporon oleaginosum]|uniref:uncharacterized protein n=1 Tax=Cutaneotrichosporon oleaginosum TaxID=879819 RepID=UPI001325EDD9|nr:hypothetical protein COLE_00532 [Cutaneotrichosporon oleaginosum]
MGKKAAAAGDGGPNTIYKVRYASSPVFEFICRNVAVMRRRSDAYLNATQILKVAGFDKPQRTRVLEREVQKGEHEKVQGGYGKYQGTWVPIERGLALAKQYNVEDLLRPIIDFVPRESVSPPPAPKHAVAPPTKRNKEPKPKEGLVPIKSAGVLSGTGRHQTPDSVGEDVESEVMDDMSESQTPSPLNGTSLLPAVDERSIDGMDIDGFSMMNGGGHARKRSAAMMDDEDEYEQLKRARGNSAVHTPPPPGQSPRYGGMQHPLTQDEYNDIVLNYFVSEATQIPAVMTNPPYNWDPNGIIDDDHHTALHWAAAMGRTRVIKLLLSAGARIFDKNNLDQTPLMRSVMFTNNYDLRKFPEVFELLHRSTLNIDKNNRTVFHHIANLALYKGKTHAARYYMEVILSRLADYPQELADVINFADEDGETALTLAARARSKRIVKALLDHGADPKLRNRDHKSAEDYILEDERFRSSPDVMLNRTQPSAAPRNPTSLGAAVFSQGLPPQLYNSEAARLASGPHSSDILQQMQALARSFEAEKLNKERDVLEAKAMLTSIHTEVNDAGRTLHNLGEQMKPLEAKQGELDGLVERLQSKLQKDLARGARKWKAADEGRENRWKNGDDPSQAGEDYSDLPELTAIPDNAEAEEERLRGEIEKMRARRGELVTRLVKAQTQTGTTDKMAQYRRLITAGCGGDINPGEIDDIVGQLLDMLENEAQSGRPAPPPQAAPSWVTS